MSRVAIVLHVERVVEDGAHGVDVRCDPGGADNTIVPHYADPGDDSLPLPGDYAALDESSGSGGEHATGYADVRHAGKAAPGEKRLYARSSNGAVTVELWLKADGSLVITNGQGAMELSPGGDFELNGVLITKQGEIKAPGEVTAKAGTPAAVRLTTHTHLTPIAPTAAPTPGT